ncbi:symmetrical bis(5'-nucleosyl)-tetraphosphatase [Vibrio gallicus]|uniref:symmetrical bis(5'-nucleosyl)-tetraphosphatase n=1 Tax=Vibrio gallicus TaxID=190897 RepID=UPI0021C303A1|nr:symmetrical bis(5'-nucleosyl)-tetraphosphatase [Vibrio gallicus]
MSTYIVGDIQGCLQELKLLLSKVQFNPNIDTLWVAGDLVARGPESLQTLRFIKSLGDSAKVVLGNHDLHLLAVSLGIHKVKEKDKTAPILLAEDKQDLLDWLRHQPLLAEHSDFVLSHAGIYPLWDLNTSRSLAKEIETILQGEHWQQLIRDMYANQPIIWSSNLTGIERHRFIINAFTRMRYCDQQGRLDMANKLSPEQLDDNPLIPWFDLPQRVPLEKTAIFGHWAALMGLTTEHVIGLDTGCVWGNHMTILRWEDQCYFEQAALTEA